MTKETVWCFIDKNGEEQCYTFKSDAEDLANGAEVYEREWKSNIKEPWEGLHEDLQRLDSEDLEAVTRQFLPKTDQRRYRVEWDKANTKQIKMKLNLKTDADILEKLESVPNKQGYIKELIRADIKKGAE